MAASSPTGLCLAGAGERVLEANASWCSLLGVDADAVVGTRWDEPLRPIDRADMAARFSPVRSGAEARAQATCGLDRARWLRLECAAAGEPAGALVISATDVSGLMSTAGELGEAFARALDAETLLQEAIDAMSEGFVYFDADDRVVCFNAKHRELFPSYADELRPGLSFEELLRAQLKGIRLENAVGREEAWIVERTAQHRNPEGPIEQRWADGRIIRLSEYKTRSGGIVAIRADITDLKRAEAEVIALNEDLERRVLERTRALEDAQAELVRRERLAALGQLIASVSHELRNPLATITTSLGVIREEGSAKGGRVARAAARIERAATRCNAIVAELLDFSRPRELAIEETPVDEWIGAILDELPVIPGVDVVRRLSAPDACVSIDRERLRRVVVNLYDNACQAIDGAGTVVVETARRDGHVAVSIIDDGRGIDGDALEIIFEPMFTTKASGVGLGLAIAKRIVEQHGARIVVDSAPAQGARFTILARESR